MLIALTIIYLFILKQYLDVELVGFQLPRQPRVTLNSVLPSSPNCWNYKYSSSGILPLIFKTISNNDIFLTRIFVSKVSSGA